MVLDSVQRRAITGRYRPTERSCAPCVTGTGRHRAGYCLLCSGVPRAVHRYRAPRSGTAPCITCNASVSLPIYAAEPRGVTDTARRSAVHPLSFASSLAPRREGHKKGMIVGFRQGRTQKGNSQRLGRRAASHGSRLFSAPCCSRRPANCGGLGRQQTLPELLSAKS